MYWLAVRKVSDRWSKWPCPSPDVSDESRLIDRTKSLGIPKRHETTKKMIPLVGSFKPFKTPLYSQQTLPSQQIENANHIVIIHRETHSLYLAKPRAQLKLISLGITSSLSICCKIASAASGSHRTKIATRFSSTHDRKYRNTLRILT